MGDEQKQELPDHMMLMSIASKGYRHYISQLKKGGRSGISGIFGSADELLSASVPTPTPLNLSDAVAPGNREELDLRSLYFAQLACTQCREFLEDFLSRCCNH